MSVAKKFIATSDFLSVAKPDDFQLNKEKGAFYAPFLRLAVATVSGRGSQTFPQKCVPFPSGFHFRSMHRK